MNTPPFCSHRRSAHVFAAARDVDAALVQLSAQRDQGDLLASRLHIKDTLDEIHSLAVLENVQGESFIKEGFVAAQGIQHTAEIGQAGIGVADDTVGAQGQLGVVCQLSLVVLGCVVAREVEILDCNLKGLPVGVVLVGQLQQGRKLNLLRGEFASEGQVAAWHGDFPDVQPPCRAEAMRAAWSVRQAGLAMLRPCRDGLSPRRRGQAFTGTT